MMKHYNIPVFLPELACPFQCSYCNQSKISGQLCLPQVDEIKSLIERNIQTFPQIERKVEIAFFGGNFTGLPAKTQISYLDIAEEFVQKGLVQGIRLSTRPDYIDGSKLELLKKYSVKTIELGAQSLDDEVLSLSGRGHTSQDVFDAAGLILNHGFRLGLQMMIGLPGDAFEKARATANKIIAAGAHETRIYPCLVIKDTQLEKLYQQGSYTALSLNQAVEWTSELLNLFELGGVRVIRIGLHPSEELNGSGLIAGPYHPSFKELVMTSLWRKLFEKESNWPKTRKMKIHVNPKEINFAVGYMATNRKWLTDNGLYATFVGDKELKERNYYITSC